MSKGKVSLSGRQIVSSSHSSSSATSRPGKANSRPSARTVTCTRSLSASGAGGDCAGGDCAGSFADEDDEDEDEEDEEEDEEDEEGGGEGVGRWGAACLATEADIAAEAASAA
jgi:hypothetical protein